MCVCKRVRESECARECVCEREKECVCGRERDRDVADAGQFLLGEFAIEVLCVGEKESECVREGECVCERERE